MEEAARLGGVVAPTSAGITSPRSRRPACATMPTCRAAARRPTRSARPGGSTPPPGSDTAAGHWRRTGGFHRRIRRSSRPLTRAGVAREGANMLQTPGDHSVAADGRCDRFSRSSPVPASPGIRPPSAGLASGPHGLRSQQRLGSRLPAVPGVWHQRPHAPPRPRSDGPDRLAPFSRRRGSPSMYSSRECLSLPTRWRQPESQPISQPETPVRVVGPLDRRGGGVAGQHVVAASAGEHHQVPLLSAAGQPAVREGVPEAVRVHVDDAGLRGAGVQHVAGAVGGHRAALAEQQSR